MFYHWLYPLAEGIGFFNIFRYITFRAFAAFVVALIVSLIWGKRFIIKMKVLQFGQSIRDDGPESHKKKAGTPTLGGVFILGSILFSTVISGNFLSSPLIVVLLVTTSYFLLGWRDDYLKIIKKNSDGVSAKGKLAWQFLTSIIALTWCLKAGVMTSELYIPFLKEPVVDLGWLYVVFGSLVIVGSSNAVNLTDGLDGLAIGPIMTSAACLGLFSYLSGHTELAQYLLIPYVEGVGELLVFAAAILGAGLGFLWFNSYPAQIFMGDVGSLSLGGALGAMAVITKNEILFVLIGGIFVVEALSVIIQVVSYKSRKKRVFKMAPIHHHFELLGWPETKVIVRFWIISALFAILALATIKLR